MKAFGDFASYECGTHPGRPGVGTCTRCGAVVCADCAAVASGRIYCLEHKPADEEEAPRATEKPSIRFLILIPVLLVIAFAAAALWFAPGLTTGLFSFYNASVTEMELQEIATAVESFRRDVGRYPSDDEGLLALRDEPAGAERWLGPYLPDGLYVEGEVVDADGNAVTYERSGEGYRLTAVGPDGEADTDDDITFEGPRTAR